MEILYGDKYRCEMRRKGQSICSGYDDEKVNFKHYVKQFKVGVMVYDYQPIKNKMQEIFQKYAEHHEDKVIEKEKKMKKG